METSRALERGADAVSSEDVPSDPGRLYCRDGAAGARLDDRRLSGWACGFGGRSWREQKGYGDGDEDGDRAMMERRDEGVAVDGGSERDRWIAEEMVKLRRLNQFRNLREQHSEAELLAEADRAWLARSGATGGTGASHANILDEIFVRQRQVREAEARAGVGAARGVSPSTSTGASASPGAASRGPAEESEAHPAPPPKPKVEARARPPLSAIELAWQNRKTGAAAFDGLEDETLGRDEPGDEPEPEEDDAEESQADVEAVRDLVARHRKGLDIEAPYAVAHAFLTDWWKVKGIFTLHRWRGSWYQWTGAHYAELGDEALNAELYKYLDTVNAGRVKPNRDIVSDVVHALIARAQLPNDVEGGTWLGGRAPWGEGEAVICCANGVLRLRDRRLWPYDPRLFSLNTIETAYDPEAKCPRWEQFQGECWGDGGREEPAWERQAIQEWFGLCLTDETKYQKSVYINGATRSGKGTTGRMLRYLLGEVNCCAPSLNSLPQTFGMQCMVGKKLAVIGDTRLDERSNLTGITEKLLLTIGEDPQSVNRKYKPAWEGILRVRVMMASNGLVSFKDDSGTIAGRFIILNTVGSFYGREDFGLEEKLRSEASGVLNWSLDGLDRLGAKGRLTDGRTSNAELAANASKIVAFAEDRLEFGRGEAYETLCSVVHGAYASWNGGKAPVPVNIFSGQLKDAFPGRVTVFRPGDGGGPRPRYFAGVRLRTKEGRQHDAHYRDWLERPRPRPVLQGAAKVTPLFTRRL